MKRISLLSTLLLLLPSLLWAWEPRIASIDIDIALDSQGTAHVTESWDVVVASGSEWYLVRQNLGDIRIEDFSVRDESGLKFRTLPRWDVDKSIEQKAGTCGINPISGGCELCWGVGSYGPHRYTVSYSMTNALKSANDYDYLHLQVVSPGLSSRPEKVRVKLHTAQAQLDTTNTRLWGFGFRGESSLREGEARYESYGPLEPNGSVIVLLRFDKGIFSPRSVVDKDFSKVLDKALKGSEYEGGEDDGLFIALFTIFIFLGMVLVIRKVLKDNGSIRDKKRLSSLFGTSDTKNVQWSRSIPFDGDIYETSFVSSHLKGGDSGKTSFVEAFMLTMVQRQVLHVTKDSRGRVALALNLQADLSYMSSCELEFYNYLKQAAGLDNILQASEFKRWSARHGSDLVALTKDFRNEATKRLQQDGYSLSGNSYYYPFFSADGQKKALSALGFKKYLEEFTIIDERQSAEVVLWQSYLVMASIFGIADRVSKELKRLSPDMYAKLCEASGNIDPYTLIILNRAFASNVNNSIISHKAQSNLGSGSSSGLGGGTSFGGGGGFSGGGFGGGSR